MTQPSFKQCATSARAVAASGSADAGAVEAVLGLLPTLDASASALKSAAWDGLTEAVAVLRNLAVSEDHRRELVMAASSSPRACVACDVALLCVADAKASWTACSLLIMMSLAFSPVTVLSGCPALLRVPSTLSTKKFIS